MTTPEMKAHRKMQQAIRKSRIDSYDCFIGKTKMTMAQLRNFDKQSKNVRFNSEKSLNSHN